MIVFKQVGDLKATERFLKNALRMDLTGVLDHYGRMGVEALAAATPVDTGKTASSWDYEIEVSKDKIIIYWINTNVNNGVNIAMLLQYGHGTRNGGYVQGRDYINPAVQPLFDSMVEKAWKEVTAK